MVHDFDYEPPSQGESAAREGGSRENIEEISSSQEGEQQRRFRSLHDIYDETDPMPFDMDILKPYKMKCG